MAKASVQFRSHPEPTLDVILTEPFLDITVQSLIREAVEKEWKPGLSSINIDCAAVEFMDSSGVGLLVAFHKRLGGGRRIRLKNVRPALRSVFALLCLEDLFEFA
jgi:anti-sigma B factor antagonist